MEKNKVTWFSIPSDNLERTTKFYAEAFDWKTEPMTKEENSDFDFYTMLNIESDENYVSKERGALNGCIVKRKIGLPTPAVLVGSRKSRQGDWQNKKSRWGNRDR